MGWHGEVGGDEPKGEEKRRQASNMVSESAAVVGACNMTMMMTVYRCGMTRTMSGAMCGAVVRRVLKVALLHTVCHHHSRSLCSQHDPRPCHRW